MTDTPDGKMAALRALTQAAERRPLELRPASTTLRAIVDIAWNHQFEPSNRAPARRELKAALAPEFLRARQSP